MWSHNVSTLEIDLSYVTAELICNSAAILSWKVIHIAAKDN